MPQGLAFIERELRGIADYASERGGWTFTRLPDTLGTSIEWLRRWNGDGAFALITTPSDARVARTRPFPVVNLASHLSQLQVPSVVVDHRQIGVLAARHLIERGFKRFGFFGTTRLWYSVLRQESFARTVRDAGGECETLEVDPEAEARGWRNQHRQLLQWLGRLRAPVGVMASTDLRAGMVLDACREMGLRVPEDVGVIGVDDDPVIAEFCDPPLTSVSRNEQRVGREAAALLARLMKGAAASTEPILIPPAGIAARRSTETVAIDDPLVAHAVSYIRAHISGRFGVEKVLKELSVSRRSLEYRFRAALQTSPYDYINQLRVDAAKAMLAGPGKHKLTSVARACGFADPRRLRAVFGRVLGVSPKAYQKLHRGDS